VPEQRSELIFQGERKMDEHANEHQIQATLINILQYRLHKNALCLAIPNGGLRHPIVAKRMKAEGLLPGSPDLVFAFPDAATFWLEMKRKGGALSDDQKGVHFRLANYGHDVEVARSVDEALVLLDERGLLR
jgi:hypothetical protein